MPPFFVLSFAVLGWIGREIYLTAPPIPSAVVSGDGTRAVYRRADIRHGQQVWLSAGGQQLGSVWGHGGYVAPDWSADWLHREALALRDLQARSLFGAAYDELTLEQRGGIDARLREEMRRNTTTPTATRCSVSTEGRGHQHGRGALSRACSATDRRSTRSASSMR